MPNKVVQKCEECGNDDISELVYPGDHEDDFEFGLTVYKCLCGDCLETLKDEYSDLSHIITNESEDDFWDASDPDKIAETGRF